MTEMDALWSGAGAALARAVAARGPAAHHVVLATTSPEGGPEARTVVLRAADSDAGTAEIWTDATSAKVAALASDPRASVLLWEPETALQVRMAGQVDLRPDPERAQALPEAARRSYGKVPASGAPIAAPFDYDETADPAAFVRLILHFDRIEILHLGARHRRAAFRRFAPGAVWSGTWMVP